MDTSLITLPLPRFLARKTGNKVNFSRVLPGPLERERYRPDFNRGFSFDPADHGRADHFERTNIRSSRVGRKASRNVPHNRVDLVT